MSSLIKLNVSGKDVTVVEVAGEWHGELRIEVKDDPVCDYASIVAKGADGKMYIYAYSQHGKRS